jgi:hypothetical protein
MTCPAAQRELEAIVQEIEAENLTDEMVCRLHEMQLDMAMRLAFFRDRPEGFGKCPPGTLHDMGVLETRIEALLEGAEDHGIAQA